MSKLSESALNKALKRLLWRRGFHNAKSGQIKRQNIFQTQLLCDLVFTHHTLSLCIVFYSFSEDRALIEIYIYICNQGEAKGGWALRDEKIFGSSRKIPKLSSMDLFQNLTAFDIGGTYGLCLNFSVGFESMLETFLITEPIFPPTSS